MVCFSFLLILLSNSRRQPQVCKAQGGGGKCFLSTGHRASKQTKRQVLFPFLCFFSIASPPPLHLKKVGLFFVLS